MPEKEDSLLERMKKMPLWQWGGITIFAGLITNMMMSLTIQGGDMSRAEKRAAEMGGAVACVFFIVV